MSPTPARVGVLGLGNLGIGMALRLVEAGFDVVGADRSDRRTDALTAGGGRSGEIEDVFTCEVVCVVTPDETAVVDFFAARTSSPGVRTVLLHSTVLPQHARELAVSLSGLGIRLVEAPVSGGPEAARRGALSILLGGSSDTIAETEPILAALSARRFVLGQIGAGSAVKLANQLLMLAAVEAAHEALALTDAFGVDGPAALEAISTATGDTWVGRNWGFFDAIVADYDAAGTPPDERPWRKDLREFADSAQLAGIDAPLARRLIDTVGDTIERSARHNKEGEVS